MPAEPLPAAVGELEEPAVGAVDVQPQLLGLGDVGDRRRAGRSRRCSSCRRAATTRNGRRPAGAVCARPCAGARPDPSAARRRWARAARSRLENPAIVAAFVLAGVRLLAHVVRAVEEVLAELGVSRGHDAERFASDPPVVSSPCDVRGEVEQIAQPPGDVLLDLHDGGARLPQAHVAVQRPARGTPRARPCTARRRGCRRGSPGPRTRTCARRRLRLGEQRRRTRRRARAARRAAGARARARLSALSAGASSRPWMNPIR